MDNKNLQIEIKKLSDEPEVHECAGLMANSEPWITLKRGYEDSVKTLTDPLKEVYLALTNGKITGFIIIIMKGSFVGYIQTIGIKEEWRNKGIGTKLLEFAEKRIFSETPNVFMCVSSFNKHAKRLYDRLGYEVIGELKDYIVSGHSEILLRKTIAPLSEFEKPNTPVNK